VGGRDQNALIRAISKFTGLGQGASGSLLGMLAPIVMGTIGQHQSATRALDANGIANLFAGQKDNIAAALPSGFGSLLSGTGLLNSLGDAARTATAAGSEATRAATSAARAVGQTANVPQTRRRPPRLTGSTGSFRLRRQLRCYSTSQSDRQRKSSSKA